MATIGAELEAGVGEPVLGQRDRRHLGDVTIVDACHTRGLRKGFGKDALFDDGRPG
ncbi:hypothetical protein D3C72_2281960 [compost metagenome]